MKNKKIIIIISFRSLFFFPSISKEDEDNESESSTPYGSFQNQLGLSPNTQNTYLWDSEKKSSANQIGFSDLRISSKAELKRSAKLSNTNTPEKPDNKDNTFSGLNPTEEDNLVEEISEFVGGGFSDNEILKALRQCNWNSEEAIDYLYNQCFQGAQGGNQFDMEMDESVTPKVPRSSGAVLELNITETRAESKPEKLDTSTDQLNRSTNTLGSSSELSKSKNLNVAQHSTSKRKELESLVQNQNSDKLPLTLVVIGHVDAGKSTLVGHLLVDMGVIDNRTMHKFEKESSQIGKASFRYAWVMDEQSEERSRGVTINVGVKNFSTPHRDVTLLDAPGHRDYVPNMISGTSQADAALLVIDARKGEFEHGFEANGQTKEHAMLAKSLGVKQIAVVVNKLDSVDWDQERFNQIQTQMKKFLKKIGFTEANLSFIPCSGLTGENLTKSATNMKWYSGKTLVEQINVLEPPAREFQKPFRFSVSDVGKVNNFGNTVSGKIENGLVSVGDKVLLMPLSEICTVAKIKTKTSEHVEFSSAGQGVDIALNGISEFTNVHAGAILCDPQKPVTLTRTFICQAVTFGFVRPLILGENVELHLGSLVEPAKIKRFIALLDRKDMSVIKKKPKLLTENQTCEIEIQTQRPVCVDLYSDCKALGRFTLRIEGKTVAAGFVNRFN